MSLQTRNLDRTYSGTFFAESVAKELNIQQIPVLKGGLGDFISECKSGGSFFYCTFLLDLFRYSVTLFRFCKLYFVSCILLGKALFFS